MLFDLMLGRETIERIYCGVSIDRPAEKPLNGFTAVLVLTGLLRNN
jgi:hypothetical protein